LNTYSQLSEIFFSVEGPDANLYQTQISPLAFTVGMPGFYHTEATNPAFTGVTSALYYLTIVPAPTSNLTVTPYSPYATFEPAQLQFTNTTLTASYNITPTAYAGTFTVSFVVNGDDSYNYNAPASFTLTATERVIQVYPALDSVISYVGYPSGPYTVSLLVPPPTNFSIVLNAPFTTFTPSVLTFTPEQSYQTYTFVSSTVQTVAFQYMLEGIDVNLYAQPAYSEGEVILRFFYYEIDETTVTNGLIIPGTKFNVDIYPVVPSNNGVSITFQNPNFAFSPSTLSFGVGQKSATVSLTAHASGVHQILFQITGPDAHWYTAQYNTNALDDGLEVTVYQGPVASPFNAGGRLLASAFVIMAVILLTLVL